MTAKEQLAKATRATQKEKLREAFRLQLKAYKVPSPVKEYKFHPDRKWRFDDCWPVQQVAIEYHGGIYTNGRHVRGKGFEADREKMNEAQLRGWTVIEVTSHHISTLAALKWLMRALPNYPRKSQRMISMPPDQATHLAGRQPST